VIVAASGSQHKWGNHLGVPSHLVPVRDPLRAGGKELLLHRTVRQAFDRLGPDVHLTAPPGDDRYRLPGVATHERSPGDFGNEYLASRDLWSTTGPTVLLLGDVYFTDRAMRAIRGHHQAAKTYRVFGRYMGSQQTGTPYGEIFAVSFWPNCHNMLDRHLARVVQAFHNGESKRRDGWTLLRSIQGTPLNEHIVCQPWFVEINDWTDDIDFPADYERHPATRTKQWVT
jgi:hypothetical protein